MKNYISIQQLIFKTIKSQHPSNISFVHEISELLGISYDSAYRRIRGEKNLSFEELNLLSTHFKISIDEFIDVDKKMVQFQPFTIQENGFGLYEWLFLMLKELQRVQASKHKEVIYAARDLPVFYYFDFPELIAFKFYFWKKTLLHISDYNGRLFSFDELPVQYMETGRHLLSTYNLIPTIELWNNETLKGIIRQIEFCWISGFFASREDALRVCNVLDNFLHHMQSQVESGLKYTYGSPPAGIEDSYSVYLNEVLLIDNIVLVATDSAKVSYMAYNTLDLLMTTNEAFFDQISASLKALRKTASHISGTSAKERNHFFAILMEKAKKLRELVEK